MIKIPEKRLWKIVKEALEKKEYGYICSNPEVKKKLSRGFLCMGIGGVQADVIGFKDVGMRRQPKLEIIAVEVKQELPNYRQRHIDQAKRASIYAHKCFFAGPREFKPKEIEIAVKSGIGLFQIDTKNKKLKQVAPPVEMHPDEINILRLMERLQYFKCAICECFWNREFTPTGYRPQNYFSKKSSTKLSKFICDTCARQLFKMLSPRLKKKYAEETVRLIKKQKKIEDRIQRFYSIVDKKLRRKSDKLERQLKNTKKYLRERISQRHKRAMKKIRAIRNKFKSI